MSSLRNFVTFGSAAVCALGIGLHQFFSAHTAERVAASTLRIETELHEILPGTKSIETSAVVPAAQIADHEAAAARWKALFGEMRNRHENLQYRWQVAMRLPLEVRARD
jgi:hypothetical protein